MSKLRRRPRFAAAVLLALGLIGGGCGDIAPATPTQATVVVEVADGDAPISRTTTTSELIKPAAVATTSTTTTIAPSPVFTSAVYEIDTTIAGRMASSWREGCPVGLENLRLLEVAHFDFDGELQIGELVVNEDQVEAIVVVFARLFDLGYPIDQMRLVDEFAADDMLSMQANNSSAFNCRVVAGTNRWSEHAYGRAIDLNPLINPYVRGGRVLPPEGEAYVDRTQDSPGLIRDGDDVVAAFSDVGWAWGGHWTSSKDYQHFSANGR